MNINTLIDAARAYADTFCRQHGINDAIGRHAIFTEKLGELIARHGGGK